MTYDLTKFDLGDMLKCSLRLRETAADAPTLESSAQRVCRFLYDELAEVGVDEADGHGPLSHRRGDPFDGAAPHVTRGEHAG